MTEQRVRSVRMSWREPFMWQRLALMVGSSTLLGGACLALHWGFVAVLVLALCAWPWPVRIRVDSVGVTLRWLAVRQTVAFAQLSAARVVPDERRWSWPRASWLKLERRGKPLIWVLAPEPVLARLAREIAGRLVSVE